MPPWLPQALIAAAVQMAIGAIYFGMMKQSITDVVRRVDKLEDVKLNKETFEEYKEARQAGRVR